MKQVLDDILLSDNVSYEFYKNYSNSDFKQWLLQVLPEVEACKNTEQDNPWHIYNCLEHILRSVQEMNKQTKTLDENSRKMLAYVMFLHDMGKPKCKVRRFSKLYNREVDSFFEHNIASKEIADRSLTSLEFNNKQKEIMKLLIEEHDIFMFITLNEDGNRFHRVLSPSLVNEYIEKYNRFGDGKELLNQLIMVGRADNLAQNPKMTANSLNVLEKMQTLLVQERLNNEAKKEQ